MRMLVLLAVITPLALAGCRKTTKPTDSGSPTPPASPTPAPGGSPPSPAGGGTASAGGGNSGIIPAGGGVGIVPNPGAALGGGGGGGAIQAVRKAATRTEIRAALTDIRLSIDTFSLDQDKMPTPQQTYAVVKASGAAKYVKMLEEGDIVLHTARTREDVWAYEGKPTGNTCLVLTSQGVEDMDLQTLRNRLAGR